MHEMKCSHLHLDLLSVGLIIYVFIRETPRGAHCLTERELLPPLIYVLYTVCHIVGYRVCHVVPRSRSTYGLHPVWNIEAYW